MTNWSRPCKGWRLLISHWKQEQKLSSRQTDLSISPGRLGWRYDWADKNSGELHCFLSWIQLLQNVSNERKHTKTWLTLLPLSLIRFQLLPPSDLVFLLEKKTKQTKKPTHLNILIGLQISNKKMEDVSLLINTASCCLGFQSRGWGTNGVLLCGINLS